MCRSKVVGRRTSLGHKVHLIPTYIQYGSDRYVPQVDMKYVPSLGMYLLYNLPYLRLPISRQVGDNY